MRKGKKEMLEEDKICRNCGHSFRDSHQMTLGPKVVTVNKYRCACKRSNRDVLVWLSKQVFVIGFVSMI